jgi:hypothetical protein
MKVTRLGYSVKVSDVTNESLYEHVVKLAYKLNLKAEFTDGTTIKITSHTDDTTGLKEFYEAV